VTPADNRGTPQRSAPAAAAQTLGERIRDIRARDRLTRTDVADASGLSPEQLQQIEAGLVDIEFKALIRLAYALRTDPGILIGGVTRDH